MIAPGDLGDTSKDFVSEYWDWWWVVPVVILGIGFWIVIK